MAHPLVGTKVHWTFVAFRLALVRIGELTKPLPSALARGPLAWDDDRGRMPDWDFLGQPEPDVEYDQRVFW